MKRFFSLIIAAFTFVCLSGCCAVHEWTGASCTEAAYCVRCGETRGEALGHDWQADAGILICSRCGAVDDSEERAILGKSVIGEAPAVSAEQPSVESAGGEVPDFEKYGIITDMAFNELCPFTTGTNNMPALTTTGELAVTAFGILPPDSGHRAREGYEWRYVIMQATFYDDNAHKNGVKVMALCEDYYDLALRGTTQRLDADGFTAYTVIHNGQEMECRCKRQGKWSEWYTSDIGRREILYSCLWELEIPSGYDGTVVGLYSSAVDWPEGGYINEVYSPDSFRLFRIS